MSERVFVVGIGLVTSLGRGVDHSWSAMLQARSGIRRIERFVTAGLPAQIAACADDDAAVSCGRRCVSMAAHAVAEAMSQSRVYGPNVSYAGFFMAAPTPANDWPAVVDAGFDLDTQQLRRVFYDDESISLFAEEVMKPYGSVTPPVLVNTACASGATALEMALEAIYDGEYEIAVVAGSDSSVCEESIAKFCLLSALSTSNETPHGACRPFSVDRNGFVMGEGAGALVLASERAVERLDLTPVARVCGAGSATDGFHRTRSSPDGSTIVASMERALQAAGLHPRAISHVNAHGTGTPENDKMESMGLRAVFGNRVSELPVTANKSQLGHTLTAAGVIEGVVSVLTIRDGIIPPTLNHDTPDPDLGVQVVGNAARPATVDYVLSNSFGFGGQNVSVVFARPDAS